MDRKLSVMEHMMCQVSDVVPINFVLTARIQGCLSEAQMRGALDKVRRKHPLLAVRVVDGDNGRFYFTPSDVPPLPLRLVLRQSEDTWEQEVLQEIKTTFDWRKGPLVRFVWVQGDGISELLVVCHHGIADGLSARVVVHDIMQFLGEPETAVIPLPLLPPADDMLPNAVLKKPVFRTKILLTRLAIKGLPVWSGFKKNKPEQAASQEPPELAFQMISWMLNESETTAVIQRAKQENTTVHGALCTAFLKAFAAQEGETTGWQRKVSSPVSIRKMLSPPVNDAFGLFIALVETTADCEPKRNFWEIAREIKQKLNHDAAADKLLFQFAVAQHLNPNAPGLELLGDYTNITYDLSITNLGRFNFPTTYGDFQLNAIFGPVVTTIPTEKILGVITVGGRLCFTFVYGCTDMEQTKADQIKTQAMAYLLSALQ